ncbi:MAG: CaiB/BaiF CoA-transferase family protein [Putridiphycobacter sp.]|nr:CaiB/BaiF CoA-transferase family protein [Putridiphycobacter sp.]
MEKSLSELVIVEIASVLAGPSVGMFFAELGARVIKIEPKHIGGDVTRTWKLPTEPKDTNISAYFSSVNYGKEYHFLDFRNKEDFGKTINFIAEADIIITNFKHGDGVKFGLDYEAVKQHNSSIIYAAISGFGDDNDRVAYDLILQAETGFMSMNGTSDSGPVKMPVALIDILAGHQLKEGILVALINRGRQGGTKVTVSLYEAAIASLANQASNYLMTKHVAKRLGSLHPNIAPYGEIFETRDQAKITFAIGSQKQFEKLLALLGLEFIIADPRYHTNANRVLNRESLAKILASQIILHNKFTILNYCLKHFVPAAEIKSIDQVFENKAAMDLVLSETIEGVETKRVKTIAFKIT